MDELEFSVLGRGWSSEGAKARSWEWCDISFLPLSIGTPSVLIGKMHLSPHPMLLPPVPRVTELVMLGPRALISISSIASSNPSQKGLYLNYHPPATNCSQGLRVLTHTFQLSPTASLSLLCLEEGSGSQDRFSLSVP